MEKRQRKQDYLEGKKSLRALVRGEKEREEREREAEELRNLKGEKKIWNYINK